MKAFDRLSGTGDGTGGRAAPRPSGGPAHRRYRWCASIGDVKKSPHCTHPLCPNPTETTDTWFLLWIGHSNTKAGFFGREGLFLFLFEIPPAARLVWLVWVFSHTSSPYPQNKVNQQHFMDFSTISWFVDYCAGHFFKRQLLFERVCG